MKALAVPFSVIGGAVATTTDYNKVIRGQVIDAVATNQNERAMNPTWGCNIIANLFDPSDALVRSDTGSTILRNLSNFVPRAIIDSVGLDVDPSTPNLVDVNVAYRASSYSPEENLSVPLSTDDTTGSTTT